MTRALGDDGEHRYIETVSKRGYGFTENVRELVRSSSGSTGVESLEETFAFMSQQRRLRINPVATVMYCDCFYQSN
jgi:DNA-binding winged helix-turn-helix (wHTH) protein